MSALPITGGCQCGAVRYALAEPLRHVHFCHCRMCQRAVGGPFAALGSVPKLALRWTRGAPALFASSSMAERGFCAACGTPLSFAYRHSAHINVTLGSLDDPAAFTPERHFGIESQLPWLHLADDWPRQTTLDDERLKTMKVHQSQE